MLIVKLFQRIISILTAIPLVIGHGTDNPEDSFTRGCHTVQTNQYNYVDFFPLHTGQSQPSYTLNFYVKTSTDAHVLLSEQPQPMDKAYEIVFGANFSYRTLNSFTAIRRQRQGYDERYLWVKDELSSDEWRRFGIKVTESAKSRQFSLKKQTNNEEILTWLDTNPMPMKYFSFSSYRWNSGSWAFNCTALSDLEWYLVENLKYDRKIAPRNSNRILFTITPSSIDLNETTNILKLNATATTTWEDERVTWDTNKFIHLNHITFEGVFVTWSPSLELTSLDTNRTTIFGRGNTSIWNNGTMIWTRTVHITTNCIFDGRFWPFDKKTCKIDNLINTQLNFSMNYESVYSNVTPPWTLNVSHLIHSISSKETNSSNYQYLWSVEITFGRNLSYEHYSVLVAFVVCAAVWIWFLSKSITWFISISNSILLLTIFFFSRMISIPSVPQQIPYLCIAYAILFVLCALSTCYSLLSLYFLKARHNTNHKSNGFSINVLKRRKKKYDQQIPHEEQTTNFNIEEQ